ncbi:MAG TPA: hypothetical protein V6C65_04500 [Allocoleopsis sp.]
MTVVGGTYNATEQILTTGLPSQLQLDRYGRIRVKTTRVAALNSQTQLTSPGSTAALSFDNYSRFCCAYKIAGIGTNVVVRPEGTIDNANWFPLTSDEADITKTANGTYSLRSWDETLLYVRFTWVSSSGGTPTIDVSWRFE